MFLKENMDKLLNEMPLKGFTEITKVTFSKYNESEYDEDTGKAIKPPKDQTPEEEESRANWLIETDGVALQKVLGYSNKIDFRRTVSNDI